MALPLEGISVLDLSQGEFGPYCAMMLADMGADVIKVEKPDIGEGWRYGGVNAVAPGLSNMFLAINRGKRSLALDIRTDEGREVMHRLVREADVVLHNMRPGVMERLGYGYAELSALNPRIVLCSESAYGETGPRTRAGQDLLTQAFSGIIALQGHEDGPPRRSAPPLPMASAPSRRRGESWSPSSSASARVWGGNHHQPLRCPPCAVTHGLLRLPHVRKALQGRPRLVPADALRPVAGGTGRSSSTSRVMSPGRRSVASPASRSSRTTLASPPTSTASSTGANSKPSLTLPSRAGRPPSGKQPSRPRDCAATPSTATPILRRTLRQP